MRTLKENLEKAKLHLDRVKRASQEIRKYEILKNLDIEDFETVKIIDTFTFRFIKLQDFLGQKLFKRFLDEIGELEENVSFLDVLDKLEKLRIIDTVEDWIEIRKLRNKLTHEYPDELEEIKKELEIAIDKINLFEEVIIRIENYLKNKNLL